MPDDPPINVPPPPGASPTPSPVPTEPNPVSVRLAAWAEELKQVEGSETVTFYDLVKFTEGLAEVLQGR